jgi:hypothetical protein
MSTPSTASYQAASRSTSVHSVIFWFVAVAMTLYGILIAEYALKYYFPGAPRLWDSFSALISSASWSSGEGSVTHYRDLDYLQTRFWMLLHTACGAICILLGPWQFSKKLRSRNPGLHRKMGYGYFGAGFLSLMGGAAFLVEVPIRDLTKDTAFYWGLWGLIALQGPTMAAALWAAIRRQIALHQHLMALSMAFFATAPVLRVLWFAAGGMTTMSQSQANYATAMFLVPLCVVLAIAWTATQRVPNPFPLVRLPRLAIVALTVLAAGGLLAGCAAVQSGYILSNPSLWLPSSTSATSAASGVSGITAVYGIFAAAFAAQLLLMAGFTVEKSGGAGLLLCGGGGLAGLIVAFAAQRFVKMISLGSASQTSLAFSFAWMGYGVLLCFLSVGAVMFQRRGSIDLAREWKFFALVWAFSPLYSLMLYPLAAFFYGADLAVTTAQMQGVFVFVLAYAAVAVIRTWRPMKAQGVK